MEKVIMKILVLCEDEWHPAQVPQEGLKVLSPEGFKFDWITDTHDWSAERMAAYPLVILTKSNNVSAADHTSWMTEEVEAAFAGHVRNGKGLLAIHSGIAGYEQSAVLRGLLGGVFLQHPEQCPVTVTPLAGHPLTAGSDPFTSVDEHYFVTLDDPSVEIFITNKSIHGEQPGGWRRMEGAGRVAVLTPGHNLEVWQYPSFQALLRNTMRWCGGRI
jgi:uncharacterized protein